MNEIINIFLDDQVVVDDYNGYDDEDEILREEKRLDRENRVKRSLEESLGYKAIDEKWFKENIRDYKVKIIDGDRDETEGLSESLDRLIEIVNYRYSIKKDYETIIRFIEKRALREVEDDDDRVGRYQGLSEEKFEKRKNLLIPGEVIDSRFDESSFNSHENNRKFLSLIEVGLYCFQRILSNHPSPLSDQTGVRVNGSDRLDSRLADTLNRFLRIGLENCSSTHSIGIITTKILIKLDRLEGRP
ncbi:expressed protein [Phakopsora pachyrhizi]|uniref:Expressed protein n=1 Tax=Phakopsora pachyrhizi TaxID=170000 RepID=A0AAV0BFV6_PHAPC|nr:expressed protein [Phakopsora pachyrhizi]